MSEIITIKIMFHRFINWLKAYADTGEKSPPIEGFSGPGDFYLNEVFRDWRDTHAIYTIDWANFISQEAEGVQRISREVVRKAIEFDITKSGEELTTVAVTLNEPKIEYRYKAILKEMEMVAVWLSTPMPPETRYEPPEVDTNSEQA